MHTVADPVPCRQCPLQNCPGLRPLDSRQLAYMEEFKAGEVRLDRSEVLIEQETESKHLYTVLDGVLMRYRTLEDGRRQIVNFMFPGDLAGLQGAFEEPASHTIETLLDSRLCVFKRGEFATLIGEHPRLGYDLVWLAAKEERALEEHIVALGQRSARERLTYLAVWLLDRALATGVSSNDNILHLSITQNQIADMLGLSLVHTNRTVRQLEREGLVIWKNREITVPDMDKACEFAQFDRHLEKLRPFI
ncbi:MULTISPECIES: Crp/Fnr family transcriptional regulator [Qipengyuania]|uniref:Crp/Fnr family transcriptional regulator n=1 Tax=Qipengyuania soli TaxID=2782568 RepID=A0A7S8F1L8_9SPHN|nr:Crp/Fnr family transcriptional regulator [Qipengyuania soli]QPC98255.1 Crp/Fnr family transcriptional regulator [Qipengyuania soli]